MGCRQTVEERIAVFPETKSLSQSLQRSGFLITHIMHAQKVSCFALKPTSQYLYTVSPYLFWNSPPEPFLRERTKLRLRTEQLN